MASPHSEPPRTSTCISRYVSFSLRGNDCADSAFSNIHLCTVDLTALSADLCFRAEDRVLLGHGYPVWKWGILGKSLQGVPRRSLYFTKLGETTAAVMNATSCLCSSTTGGSAGHEHQADGPNEEETGVHGSSPVKQIRPWCLLVTIFICIQYRITNMLEFAHIQHMLYTII